MKMNCIFEFRLFGLSVIIPHKSSVVIFRIIKNGKTTLNQKLHPFYLCMLFRFAFFVQEYTIAKK